LAKKEFSISRTLKQPESCPYTICLKKSKVGMIKPDSSEKNLIFQILSIQKQNICHWAINSGLVWQKR
jgi:hypothetical protein